jgi:hypothetical protein
VVAKLANANRQALVATLLLDDPRLVANGLWLPLPRVIGECMALKIGDFFLPEADFDEKRDAEIPREHLYHVRCLRTALRATDLIESQLRRYGYKIRDLNSDHLLSLVMAAIKKQLDPETAYPTCTFGIAGRDHEFYSAEDREKAMLISIEQLKEAMK